LLVIFVLFFFVLLKPKAFFFYNSFFSLERYAISNLLAGEPSMKYRLWISAIFSYIFAAYFCQLLYAEYNNFSVRRLQYLVQADPSSQQNSDPDTPPQKYFTVMVERIPAHLRSAALLKNFFEKLFPGNKNVDMSYYSNSMR
jgi:hypothetical protein